MKKIVRLLLVILILLMALAPVTAANWTLMIYMDGDNDLEQYAINNFLQIASVGSTKDVNIIVLLDRVPGYNSSYGDWTDAMIFKVAKGMTPTRENASEDLGEVNMADPQTLVNFVNWCVSNYPAEHYALILWDHGTGWKFKQATPIKGICWDFTNKSDYLTLEDLKKALLVLRSKGINLDIIGFDACLMGMLEVAYSVNTSMPSAIMIASENIEPSLGWPYKMILQNLTANPSMTPKQLATEIVKDYYSYYTALISEDPQLALAYGGITLSALYVNNTIDERLNEFVQSVMDSKDYYAVAIARHNAVEFGAGLGYSYIDLYDFVKLVMLNSSDEGVKASAIRLMDAINSSVIAEKHGSLYELLNKRVGGISIWFPTSKNEYDLYNLAYGYERLEFANDTLWDEFLKWFYGMPKPVIEIHSIARSVAKGDVAVFIGDVYGADSANWSLEGPYDMSYSNIPLDTLHDFIVQINTTDLFINHKAEVGTYIFKVSAKDTCESLSFDIVEPYVTVTTPKNTVISGTTFEVIGTTNVADTGSILDDYLLTIDKNWMNKVVIEVYNSNGKLVYENETEIVGNAFRHTIVANWTPGLYKIKVTVKLNPYFNVTNETTIEVKLKDRLPGLANMPKDLNGDGILEDFNGNGRLDFDDVVEFYQHMDWIKDNYPVNIVDQNKDGKLDFNDVIALFKRL